MGHPPSSRRSKHDIYFAQGYVHAEDRLWQMEMGLRRMQGRWAEWAGPSGVAADALARRLGVMSASERDYAALKADSRAMLDAYAAGVNAYLPKAARCRSSTPCWAPSRRSGGPPMRSPSCDTAAT